MNGLPGYHGRFANRPYSIQDAMIIMHGRQAAMAPIVIVLVPMLQRGNEGSGEIPNSRDSILRWNDKVGALTLMK